MKLLWPRAAAEGCRRQRSQGAHQAAHGRRHISRRRAARSFPPQRTMVALSNAKSCNNHGSSHGEAAAAVPSEMADVASISHATAAGAAPGRAALIAQPGGGRGALDACTGGMRSGWLRAARSARASEASCGTLVPRRLFAARVHAQASLMQRPRASAPARSTSCARPALLHAPRVLLGAGGAILPRAAALQRRCGRPGWVRQRRRRVLRVLWRRRFAQAHLAHRSACSASWTRGHAHKSTRVSMQSFGAWIHDLQHAGDSSRQLRLRDAVDAGVRLRQRSGAAAQRPLLPPLFVVLRLAREAQALE